MVFTYIWVIYMANVSKYSIHGASGITKEQCPSRKVEISTCGSAVVLARACWWLLRHWSTRTMKLNVMDTIVQRVSLGYQGLHLPNGLNRSKSTGICCWWPSAGRNCIFGCIQFCRWELGFVRVFTAQRITTMTSSHVCSRRMSDGMTFCRLCETSSN